MPEFFLYSLFLLPPRTAVSLFIFITLTLGRTRKVIPPPWYKRRGWGNQSLEFLICCSISKRFFLQWKTCLLNWESSAQNVYGTLNLFSLISVEVFTWENVKPRGWLVLNETKRGRPEENKKGLIRQTVAILYTYLIIFYWCCLQ